MCTPMSYAGSAPDSRHWGFGKHSSPDWGLWIMILYEPYPGTDFAEGRRTGRGCCAKRGPWSWPNNHSLFSVAMRCLSGLQLSPAFLSSSHSHCPCTCCSITCQPTKTQRLWIICQCLNCWNCVSPGHFFSHIFTPCLCSLLLSGTEVSCRRHSHGALLCSRVGKVLCCCFVVCPTDYYCICSPSQDNI